ncbi:Dehydrogenase/reductase SDR family member 7B [Hondaea fermentalgiana]|uniref:Dehydrogenase/reductase SDR family member 7B n=1 Tax=Hondaea fermentalgiana TaxID=2315210 RepID=A0A2R5GU44_9STRA|nr:Dehydrogenase/reductase SDR family member 7B [Hondaea fermentalgiana]|eukprot:GBG32173.1 Dehydrogenase/reductase SDR family member 7B [Hondaea fermentalgiana]
MKVEGLVAVITGGGSGMGQEMVVQLAEAGCHVAFCDVSEASIEETIERANAAKSQGVRVMGRKVDVTDRAALQRFAKEILAENENRINLLFANAGIFAHGPLLHGDDASEEHIAKKEREWDNCFDVDYFGVLHSIRVFLPHIVRQDKGYVVVTCSVNSYWTWPEQGCYTVSKFAVRGLTEALLTETYAKAPHVKVACVHPGFIRTNIVRNSEYGKDASGKDTRVASDFDKIPGMPASEAAAWILDGVANDQTRIIVGYDAILWDKMARISPHGIYSVYRALSREGVTEWDPVRPDEKAAQIEKVTLLGWLRILANGGLFILAFTLPSGLMRSLTKSTGASPRQLGVLLIALVALIARRKSLR